MYSVQTSGSRTRSGWIACGCAIILFGGSLAAAQGPPIDPSTVNKLLEGLLGQPSAPSEQSPEESPPYEAAPEVVTEADERKGVQVDDTGLVDLHVRGADIGAVLEWLSYEAQANIVSTTSVQGSITANLYDVTLEQTLDAILTPNGFAYRDTGATIFVGTPEELGAMRPPPVTQVFRLQYISPKEAAQAVEAVLNSEAKIVEGGAQSNGGGGGEGGATGTMTSAGEAYLIVTDQPDRLEAAGRLIAEIDRRPQQVLIEATILRATLNETNQFGIDFTMLGGVDFQNVGGASNASADLTLGALPADELQQTTFNLNTDFANNVAAGGFTFGVIKDSIAAFVRALEEVTDVVVVANPKIAALNKQEAEVIVGRRDGYLTTTVTETAAVQTVEFLETGTQIKFRPVINGDGTVRLTVHPKDSNGGLSAAQLPFEETTEAHADVLVNDGHTVLIGGLFRERTNTSRSQIPLLGDLPGAGLLFGSRDDTTVREEVIILLTVHVLKNSDAENETFGKLVDDIERIRVGIRQGLLGTGRERLAQAFYHEAIKHAEADEMGRALFNAQLALHNRPTHLPAIKLRERLLEDRLWDDEGMRMRTLIWKLIGRGPTSTPMLFDRPRVKTLDAPTGDGEWGES